MSEARLQEMDRAYLYANGPTMRRKVLSKSIGLVTGRQGFFPILKHELITPVFGPLPGALGFAARKRFYRRLYQGAGMRNDRRTTSK